MIKLGRGNVSKATSVPLLPRELSGNSPSVGISWLLDPGTLLPQRLWGARGIASAPLRGLCGWDLCEYKEKLTRGSRGGSDKRWAFIAVTSRPGPSPPDAGLWCETTPFSMCSCDCTCDRPPSAKARAGRSRGTWALVLDGLRPHLPGLRLHEGDAHRTLGTFTFSTGLPMGSTRYPRNTKAGGPIPSSPQLRALLRLEAPFAEKARCVMSFGQWGLGLRGAIPGCLLAVGDQVPGRGRPAGGRGGCRLKRNRMRWSQTAVLRGWEACCPRGRILGAE